MFCGHELVPLKCGCLNSVGVFLLMLVFDWVKSSNNNEASSVSSIIIFDLGIITLRVTFTKLILLNILQNLPFD